MSDAPAITVVIPVYRAADAIPGLVDSLAKQGHPDFPDQASWMRAIIVDNASDDGTSDAVREAFRARGFPSNWHLEVNPENLGLARSLNRALEKIQTPFVLTCHADVRFKDEFYVASMLRLLQENPSAGAITGQPEMEPETLSLEEKVYALANLMDIIPVSDDAEELVPIGFCESRCDGFRLEAMRAAGMYPEELRLAGEDQVLSAALRKAGYRTLQAPGLRYTLGLSAMQDTLGKLIQLQRRFGRANPRLLLAHRGTAAGILGSAAGENRRARTLMRVLQLAGGLVVLGSLPAIVKHRLPSKQMAIYAGLIGARTFLSRRQISAVEAGPAVIAVWVGLQPAADLAFTVGLVEGSLALIRGRDVW